jgi:hypothetical protein
MTRLAMQTTMTMHGREMADVRKGKGGTRLCSGWVYSDSFSTHDILMKSLATN